MPTSLEEVRAVLAELDAEEAREQMAQKSRDDTPEPESAPKQKLWQPSQEILDSQCWMPSEEWYVHSTVVAKTLLDDLRNPLVDQVMQNFLPGRYVQHNDEDEASTGGSSKGIKRKNDVEETSFARVRSEDPLDEDDMEVDAEFIDPEEPESSMAWDQHMLVKGEPIGVHQHLNSVEFEQHCVSSLVLSLLTSPVSLYPSVIAT